MHDGRSGATCTDLGIAGGIIEEDVGLIAAFDRSHGKLASGLEFEGLAFEDLNLGDDHVYFKLCVLAGLDADILALADNLDLALVAVEELETNALVHEIWIVESDSFIRVVCILPHVTPLSLCWLCRLFSASGTLTSCRLNWSSYFLLLLRLSRCWSCATSDWCTTSSALRCIKGRSTCAILSALPVTDVFLSLANKGNMGSHPGVVGFKPGLLGLFTLLANSVAVEEHLRLNLSQVVAEEVVARGRVPEEELEAVGEDFHDVHGGLAVLLASLIDRLHHLGHFASRGDKRDICWLSKAGDRGEESTLMLDGLAVEIHSLCDSRVVEGCRFGFKFIDQWGCHLHPLASKGASWTRWFRGGRRSRGSCRRGRCSTALQAGKVIQLIIRGRTRKVGRSTASVLLTGPLADLLAVLLHESLYGRANSHD